MMPSRYNQRGGTGEGDLYNPNNFPTAKDPHQGSAFGMYGAQPQQPQQDRSVDSMGGGRQGPAWGSQAIQSPQQVQIASATQYGVPGGGTMQPMQQQGGGSMQPMPMQGQMMHQQYGYGGSQQRGQQGYGGGQSYMPPRQQYGYGQQQPMPQPQMAHGQQPQPQRYGSQSGFARPSMTRGF